jgi:transposase
MTAVMIGVDPAKRSHAMAVLDGTEGQLAALRVGNDRAGYRDMVRLARRWPDRTWAVEGAAGVGAQLARRLVADGETVLDVPPKLATRARIFDVGHAPEERPGRRPHRRGGGAPHHGPAPGGPGQRDGRAAADEPAAPGPGPVPHADGEPAPTSCWPS